MDIDCSTDRTTRFEHPHRAPTTSLLRTPTRGIRCVEALKSLYTSRRLRSASLHPPARVVVFFSRSVRARHRQPAHRYTPAFSSEPEIFKGKSRFENTNSNRRLSFSVRPRRRLRRDASLSLLNNPVQPHSDFEVTKRIWYQHMPPRYTIEKSFAAIQVVLG